METTLRRTTPKFATRPLVGSATDAAPFPWHAPTVVIAMEATSVMLWPICT